MDTRIIEVRKTILISRLLAGVTKFSANINIDFIPDEVIVKSIIFIITDPTDPDNASSSIYSDLVNDYIGTFSDTSSGNSVTQSLTFTLRKPVKGLYNFSLCSSASNINDNDMQPYIRTGDINVYLEFVKYKEVAPQKIY